MSTQKLLKKFERIYQDTYKHTLKYIICKCNNLNDVDDIIQETYLELFKVIQENRKIENYQSYIITIAKNKTIKYFELHKKTNTISIFQENDNEKYMIDLDAGIDIESDFIKKENIDEIWNYLKNANADIARIFYLHFILDMTFKDISKELEVSESTIKSSLYRMIIKLKNFIIGGDLNAK